MTAFGPSFAMKAVWIPAKNSRAGRLRSTSFQKMLPFSRYPGSSRNRISGSLTGIVSWSNSTTSRNEEKRRTKGLTANFECERIFLSPTRPSSRLKALRCPDLLSPMKKSCHRSSTSKEKTSLTFTFSKLPSSSARCL